MRSIVLLSGILHLLYVKANVAKDSSTYSVSSDYNNLYKKCDDVPRNYIFDFSSDFLTSDYLEMVKNSLKKLMQLWFNEKIENLIDTFNNTNVECTSADDCFGDINTLNYISSASQEYIDIYCITFSANLLKGNESNAVEDLMKYYSYLPWATIFNVPDYRCLEKLLTCIPSNKSLSCVSISLDSCPPVSTESTTSSITIKSTYTITTIATTTKNSSINDDATDPCAEYDCGNGNCIAMNNAPTCFCTCCYITDESGRCTVAKPNPCNGNAGILCTSGGGSCKETLDCGYYCLCPSLPASCHTAMYCDGSTDCPISAFLTDTTQSTQCTNNSEMTTSKDLKITSPSTAKTSTTTTSMTTSATASTTVPTTSSTSSTTVKTTTEQRNKNITDFPASKQNDKEKTIIIVAGIIIGSIIIIICLCIVFYRKHLQRKRIEQIIITHPANNDEWELTWDKLLIKSKELGSGAYGQVLQGKLLEVHKTVKGKHIEDNKEVAIKILQRYTNERSEKCFLNEIQMMKQISSHRNIVKMMGCITVGERICLVLEYCPYQDLLKYVKNKHNELLEFLQNVDHIKKEFHIFAWQIAQGMNFLASEGIVHRDLAARNILIDKFKVAKISDFGLSVQTNDKHKNSSCNNIAHVRAGKFPLKWMAYESLKSYEFSLQSDIWAFGIVLFEIYSFGETPFAEIESSDLLNHLEAGRRLQQPTFCSDEIYQIMLKCWNSNPSLRPMFNDIITLFTLILEFATVDYGYLDVLKTDTNDLNDFDNFIRFENV